MILTFKDLNGQTIYFSSSNVVEGAEFSTIDTYYNEQNYPKFVSNELKEEPNGYGELNGDNFTFHNNSDQILKKLKKEVSDLLPLRNIPKIKPEDQKEEVRNFNLV